MDKRVFFRFPVDLFEDNWIDQAFRDMDRLWTNVYTSFPPTDVLVDQNGDLTLRMAIAGYDQDSISITTEDDFILIEGKEQKVEEKYTVVSKGMKGSSFKTKYPMSVKFDLSKIEASFSNGILEIKVPVSEEKKPKKVSIKV